MTIQENKIQIANDIENSKLDSAFNRLLLFQCDNKACGTGVEIDNECPIAKTLKEKGYLGGYEVVSPTCVDFITAMLMVKSEELEKTIQEKSKEDKIR